MGRALEACRDDAYVARSSDNPAPDPDCRATMPDTPLPTDALPEMAPTPELLPEAQAPVEAAAELAEHVAEPVIASAIEAAVEPAAQAGADSEAPTDAPAATSEPAPPELSLNQCAARLAELFPALFAPPVKPIKLRIQADVQARAPGVFSRRVLSVFLHRHTTSTAYIKALVHLGQRFDLDGQPAGEIAAEHREAAVVELARRREVMETRREAERLAQRQALRESNREAEKAQRAAYQEANKLAQQQAQEAQRVQQEQERQRREAFNAQDGDRRERIALLRAWEGSTLTRANFCVLKRIDEATLEAQLALAREDLAQRAAMPHPAPVAPQHQHQPQEPRRDRRPDARHGPRRDPAQAPHRGQGSESQGRGQGPEAQGRGRPDPRPPRPPRQPRPPREASAQGSVDAEPASTPSPSSNEAAPKA